MNNTTVNAIASDRVKNLAPYAAGRPSADEDGKLSSNESPLSISPAIRERLASVADLAHRYHGTDATRRRVAEWLGVAPTELVLASGSDELCYLVSMVVLHPERQKVVLSEPSYAIDVTVSNLANANIVRVPLVDGSHDLSAMAEAAQDARLVWVPTPHNPTGRAVSASELERFVASVPANCLVVIDEAYRSYVEPRDAPDSIGLVRGYPNVLVQRTFSKDFGLAGLRAGFGIGHQDLIAAFDRVRGPFNVNIAALEAMEGALESEAWRDMVLALVKRERALFEHFLTERGIEFYPSQANFVTVKIPWIEIGDAIAHAGLSIRRGEDLGLPGWCRISIGWPPQMAILRGVLDGWVSSFPDSKL